MNACVDVAAFRRFPAPLAVDPDFQAFLLATARYLLSPADLLKLGRLDSRELDEIGLAPADFDDLLAAVWRDTGR